MKRKILILPDGNFLNASWTNYYAVKPKLAEDWIMRLPRIMVMITEMFTLPFDHGKYW
jgi:hypothetical protein